MIKNWENYINEDLDEFSNEEDIIEKYSNLKDEIMEKIELSVENDGGNVETFINSFKRNPDDYKIEGLINDSDIYDFYLKFRNDIDELLNDINYFDEVPTDNNIFNLYDYTIKGTVRAVEEIVNEL